MGGTEQIGAPPGPFNIEPFALLISSHKWDGEGEGEGEEEVRWRGEMTCQVSLTAGCLSPILRPAHERGIRHIVATAESMRIDLHTLQYKVHVCEYIHRGQRNALS